MLSICAKCSADGGFYFVPIFATTAPSAMAPVWQEVSSWPPTSSLLMLSPGLKARGLSLPLSAWHQTLRTQTSAVSLVSVLRASSLYHSQPCSALHHGPLDQQDQAPPPSPLVALGFMTSWQLVPIMSRYQYTYLKAACICVCMHVSIPLCVGACVSQCVVSLCVNQHVLMLLCTQPVRETLLGN